MTPNTILELPRIDLTLNRSVPLIHQYNLQVFILWNISWKSSIATKHHQKVLQYRWTPILFPFAHNLHMTLWQVLKEEWHDLTLDHATDSSFLFPFTLSRLSFLDRARDIDLLIYISDIFPSDEQSLPMILLLIVSSTSHVSPFGKQSLLTILLLIVSSFSKPSTNSNLGTFLVHLSIVPSLRKAPIGLVYKPAYVFLCPLASSVPHLHSNLVSSLGLPLVPSPHWLLTTMWSPSKK